MKEKFKLFLALFKFAIKRNLENRWTVIFKVFQSSLSLFMALFFINIIYSQTQTIQSWTKYEVFLLTGIYQLMVAMYQGLFRLGIYQLPYLVQSGELDLLLSKPINSQFYISIRHMRPYKIFDFLPALILIIYSLNQLNITFNIISWILLITTLSCGTLIFYSIYYMLATLSIWLVQMTALSNIYHILIEPLAIPLDIIGPKMTYILTFIIPMALVITIPIKIFLNKTPIYYAGIGFIIGLLLLTLSILFWNFALRHYTSASS